MHRIAFLIALLLPMVASALTPTPTAAPHPDVTLHKAMGTYRTGCLTGPDTDLVLACFVRADLVSPFPDIDCVTATQPNTAYYSNLVIHPTPGINAEIRCYVTDLDGNVSGYSPNKGDIDFTAPRRPWVK